MRRKLVWIIAASVFAVAIAVYHHDTAELARLHQDIVSMRARDSGPRPVAAISLAGTRDRPIDGLRQPVPQRSGNERATDEDERPVADERSSAARWDDEARASLSAVEDRFAAEAIDPSWLSTATAEIREHLGALVTPPSTSLGSVDCRGSMCRVELLARDHDAMKQVMDRAFGVTGQASWNGPVMADYPPVNPDGTALAVLYMGRDGTSLQKPP